MWSRRREIFYDMSGVLPICQYGLSLSCGQATGSSGVVILMSVSWTRCQATSFLVNFLFCHWLL